MADLNPEEQLNRAKLEAEELKSVAKNISKALNDAVTNAGDLADQFGISRSISTNIEKSAEKLIGYQKQDLADKSRVREIQKDARLLQVKISLGQSEINRLYKEAEKLNETERGLIQDILEQKVEELEVLKELSSLYGDVLNTTKQISKESKYFDKAAEFLNKVPLVGPIISKPFRDIAVALREAHLEGTSKIMAGLEAASKSVAVLSLGFFVTQAFKANAQVTELQKSLLLSAEQANKLREGFIASAKASGDTFITTDKLLAANIALSKQLGFSKRFSDDLNIGFINLTKRIGLSEEAAGGLIKAAIITGRKIKDIENEASGVVSAVSSQYGIQLNVQEVLEKAGKTSAEILANFKGNPVALVEGISKMKALGTTLEQTKKQAQGLLDFESSIKNQLEAQLFTGRQLNFERARELAMNNDLVGLQQELVNQGLKYSEFQEANAFSRDAMARSMNLSTEELADQLLTIELQTKSQSQILAIFGKQAAERASALSAQEKFNAAVEKVSGLFANLLDGPLGSVVDLMSDLASSSKVVYGILGTITALSFASIVGNVISLANALTTAAIAAGAVEAFINPLYVAGGILALGAITGAIMSSIDSSKEAVSSTPSNNSTILHDGVISPDGKVIASLPKNTISFDPNDSITRDKSGNIIAGTNLGGNKPDNSDLIDAIAKLGDRLDQLSERPVIARPSEFAGPMTIKQIQNINRILV
jgi:hypothetical protein